MLPDFIKNRLQQRHSNNNLRTLKGIVGVDFASNDYLGLAGNKQLTKDAINLWKTDLKSVTSAKGSRLLGGNLDFFEALENEIANFHNAEAGLLYPSGYLANLGLFSSLQERSATILFDELAHASVRDGIRLSHCKSYHFRHNDFNHLEKLLKKVQKPCFIYLEAVHSMLGDSPDAEAIKNLCQTHNANLILDEAHSGGIYGNNGNGWACKTGLDAHCFARIYTYGKAFGIAGGAIVCSKITKNYLINFSRPFIYSTGLLPVQAAFIKSAYKAVTNAKLARKKLKENIGLFETEPQAPQNQRYIRPVLLKDLTNAKVKLSAIEKNNFCIHLVKPPTVPKGMEMIRINLHSFNTAEHIKKTANLLYG